MVSVHRPKTLSEALEIRSRTGAKPFAGGTDLMVQYRAKNQLPPSLDGPVLFLDAVQELSFIREDSGELVIGSTLPMAVLAGEKPVFLMSSNAGRGDSSIGADAVASAKAVSLIPQLLQAAAVDLAAPGLRNRATAGGNIANASPAGDTLPPFYVMDAELELASSRGSRRIPISDFILGPGKTVLGADEIIHSIHVKKPLPTWSYWRKVGTRRANALTKLSVAAAARIANGRIGNFALALGAVAPTIVRSSSAEKLINGVSVSDWLTADASSRISAIYIEALAPYITPIDDQRSTARYRRKVALNLIGDALEQFTKHLKETT